MIQYFLGEILYNRTNVIRKKPEYLFFLFHQQGTSGIMAKTLPCIAEHAYKLVCI